MRKLHRKPDESSKNTDRRSHKLPLKHPVNHCFTGKVVKRQPLFQRKGCKDSGSPHSMTAATNGKAMSVILKDTETLRSEIRTFVQSCGDGEEVAADILEGLIETHRLTGRSLQELWHKHVLGMCCLERIVQLSRN